MKYKLFIQLLSILISPIILTAATPFSESKDSSDTKISFDSNTDSTTEYFDRHRKTAQEFYENLLSLAEPSTLSGGAVTDYTFHTSSRYNKIPYILNGDAQYPIGLGGKRWYCKNFISTFHIIPEFKVRILNNDRSVGDSSLPVRTPSYLPRISYYVSWKSLWGHGLENSNIDSKWSISRSLFFSLSAFHHSNGQDQREIVNGNINAYSGNFGENAVFELGVHYINVRENGDYIGDTIYDRRNKHILKRCSKDWESCRYCRKNNWRYQIAVGGPRHVLYGKLSYEHHPAFLSNSNLIENDSVRLDLYSRFRINFQGQYIVYKKLEDYYKDLSTGAIVRADKDEAKSKTPTELYRLVLNSNILLGKLNSFEDNKLTKITSFDISKRINIWLTWYERRLFPNIPNFALFFQAAYYGSDNYNIYFSQSMYEIRFGIAFGVMRSSSVTSTNIKDRSITR